MTESDEKREGEDGVDTGFISEDKCQQEERITTAYFGFNQLSWVWQPTLPKWQRAAVISLLHPHPLTHDDHPFHLPDKEGVPMYNVTDKDGVEILCLSLAQVEYLVYYIHEMRLADPVMVAYLAQVNASKDNGGTGEEVEKPGPPEYPKGEDVVSMPDSFISEDSVQSVEEVFFTSAALLKRVLRKQQRHKKRAPVVKYLPIPPEKSGDSTDLTKAVVDDATPGPDLRRGPENKSYSRHDQDDDKEEEAHHASDPLIFEETQQPVSDTDDFGTPEESPSPDTPTTNFTKNYYEHARKALFYATMGGKASLDQMQHSAGVEQLQEPAHPSIGRSLFISLKVTTWEADDETVLEAGWSAMWWEEKDTEAASFEDRYEELRDAGHIIVADMVDKHNGHWKPDYRSYYRYGNSEAVESSQVNETLQNTIRDLSRRAGGGPTYVIVHSNDAPQSALDAVGCQTKDWFSQFAPPRWSVPFYEAEEALGETFVIDTAILTVAAQYDPADGPAPIKTELSLEQVSWALFGNEEHSLRHPSFSGNAGNDAFYNLEVFLSLITVPSLQSLRPRFSFELEEAEEGSTPPFQTEDVGSSSPGGGEGDSSDEDDLIKGVHVIDEDGREIMLD